MKDFKKKNGRKMKINVPLALLVVGVTVPLVLTLFFDSALDPEFLLFSVVSMVSFLIAVCFFICMGVRPRRSKSKSSSSRIPDKVLQELFGRIVKFLKETEAYTKVDFSISDIISGVGSNRTYTSSAINRVTGHPFSYLINSLRIKKSYEIIRAHPEMPITQVAENSGFHSSNSFQKWFKIFSSVTPRQFKREARLSHRGLSRKPEQEQ